MPLNKETKLGLVSNITQHDTSTTAPLNFLDYFLSIPVDYNLSILVT